MAQKTSINIKPCNVRSSGPHNRRSAEYLARIRKENLYIRTDLTAKNEAWGAPELGDTSLTDYHNQIAAMVKEKTGRAMQTKDRKRVNKKTGKVTIVRGSTPLKEGVVVIKEDTTMKQLQHFCEVCKERWGITALQIFIHRDEGHYDVPGDTTTWKPNLHAHIVWDWMNHDTGKSYKLQDTDMSEIQTLLAECLGMERGISKEITGKKHLERIDFIIAKQKQEAEQAIAAKEQAEEAHRNMEKENKELEQANLSLGVELAELRRKKKAADKENADSIKSGLANLFGKGKYAAIEKENETLRAENERIKQSFPNAVKNKVDELTRALVAKKQDAEAERDRALALIRSFTTERDKAAKQLQAQKDGEQHRISQAVLTATTEKDKTIRLLQSALKASRYVLTTLADLLYKASEVFRRAIDAIIHFGTEQHKSFFAPSEAADIKSVMQEYGDTPEQQKAVGEWLCDYAESRQPFDEIKHHHTLKEVGDVANGAYDCKFYKRMKGVQR